MTPMLDDLSWNCFVSPKYHHVTNRYVARLRIAARKYRHGYYFLIRYRLCARFGVRAVYYVGDLLISTSNPPATRSSASKPRHWGSPRLLESIIEQLLRLKHPRFNLSYDASRSFGLLFFRLSPNKEFPYFSRSSDESCANKVNSSGTRKIVRFSGFCDFARTDRTASGIRPYLLKYLKLSSERTTSSDDFVARF